MKYIVILGDGMADEPIKALHGKTPLEAADTKAMDELARCSEQGLAKMIPDGMQPGSDTANLSVLGYDPKKYYSGRSPLEALSIGVPMEPDDIAIRCNFVTLSEEKTYEKKIILDHSAGEITTEESKVLLKALQELEDENFQFYLGTSYRHCLIWKKGRVLDFVPPHDILARCIKDFLPKDVIFYEKMRQSFEIMNQHPINQERAARGKNKANAIWLWGAGTKPQFPSFEKLRGKKGAMISAVDLLKGIAVGADMKVVLVPGANGMLHTNYEGKVDAALKVLLEENYDFVYIHVEAPDEMGHQGNLENKIKSIEYLDSRVVQRMKEKMDASKEAYRMLVLPDHPTPIACRTHTDTPIPYLLYDSRKKLGGSPCYSETEAKRSGLFLEHGYMLIEKLLEREIGGKLC